MQKLAKLVQKIIDVGVILGPFVRVLKQDSSITRISSTHSPSMLECVCLLWRSWSIFEDFRGPQKASENGLLLALFWEPPFLFFGEKDSRNGPETGSLFHTVDLAQV